MTIEMKSPVLKVVKVIKKTSAKVFSKVDPGDSLVLSITLEHQGGASNGVYASMVKVDVIKYNGEPSLCVWKSMSQLANILENFDLKETPNDKN